MVSRLCKCAQFAAALVGLSLTFAGSAEAKEKRTRYFEVQPMVGYSWVNMTGFSENKFQREFAIEGVDQNDPVNSSLEQAQVPVQGQGLSVGAALQLKLWVFVLGARYSYTKTPDFGLHTVGADLGLRLGSIVSVYGRMGPGFAFQSGIPDGINTRGLAVSVSGGLEFHVAEPVSFGLGLDTDVLLLTRQGQLEAVGSAANNGVTAENIRKLDGSAVGFQLRPQLHFIWHI
jgi:opacity protein-like surface antigen